MILIPWYTGGWIAVLWTYGFAVLYFVILWTLWYELELFICW
jgi:hypothetical protein